jgi:hypothetical protein
LSIPASKNELKTLLRENGFSSLKAEVWAEFVRQVLAIYWAAADKLLTPHHWEKFKKKKGALGAPKRKKNVIIRTPIEDAITSEIGFLAKELIFDLAADHFLRQHDVKFDYEVLVYSDNRAGRHSKKIDFNVYCASRDAPQLAIEAKPLTSINDIDKRYLGQEGIGCFFTKDSAYTDGPLGAMLAYTISNENVSMQKPILVALQKYKPVALNIKSISIDDKNVIDCSHHDRSDCELVPITILHLERIFSLDVHEAVDDFQSEEILPSRISTKKRPAGLSAAKKRDTNK